MEIAPLTEVNLPFPVYVDHLAEDNAHVIADLKDTFTWFNTDVSDIVAH